MRRVINLIYRGADMRKCIRCEIEMIEDYDVKVEGGAYGLKITKPGILKKIWERFMQPYVLNVDISSSILRIQQQCH